MKGSGGVGDGGVRKIFSIASCEIKGEGETHHHLTDKTTTSRVDLRRIVF